LSFQLPRVLCHGCCGAAIHQHDYHDKGGATVAYATYREDFLPPRHLDVAHHADEQRRGHANGQGYDGLADTRLSAGARPTDASGRDAHFQFIDNTIGYHEDVSTAPRRLAYTYWCAELPKWRWKLARSRIGLVHAVSRGVNGLESAGCLQRTDARGQILHLIECLFDTNRGGHRGTRSIQASPARRYPRYIVLERVA
jgi:hypothetical protein